jgi:hypothetical protein
MIGAFGFNPKYLYCVSSEQKKGMVRDTQEWIEKYNEGVRGAKNRYVENATKYGVSKLQRWIQTYYSVRETISNVADATRLARVRYHGRSGVVAAAIPIVISPGSYDFPSYTSVSVHSGSSMTTPPIDLTSFLDTIIRFLNTIIGLLLLTGLVLRVLQSLLDQQFSRSGKHLKREPVHRRP